MEIGCIIEGDGEEDAIPILLRRVIQEIDPTLYVQIRRPFRQPKGRLKQRHLLARAVDLLARQLSPPRALFILLDADDDCPAEIGPQLLAWAQAARGDIPIAVVMAKCEYEAWFLAAAESLQGRRGLAHDLRPPPDCESVQDAKGWLRNRMTARERYSPTSHQASFSQVMSLEQARRAPSFDKLCRDVRRLVDAMRAGSD